VSCQPTRFLHYTARRYASAVYAVVVCLSVWLSVRSSVRHKPVLYRNDWTNQAGFWYGGFLPSIPHCFFKEIEGISKNWGYFPSGTLSQTPDLEKISPRQNSSSSSSSTVELVDDTYTTIDESWLFTTSRRTVTL